MRANYIQSIWQRVQRSFAAIIAVVVLALVPIAAHADDFTGGTYGSGVYGSSVRPDSGGSTTPSDGSSSSGGSTIPSSSSGADSTVIETPSGLEVAINLSNGQVIPSGGYYITITPLNGQGKSFDKVEIYLDGKLAYTGTPDDTGTLRWLWDTTNNPASKVKIIVFGPGTDTTTHEFDLTVTPADAASSTPTTTSADDSAAAPQGAGWPWWLIAVIIGGILLIALIIWLIARRRRRDQQPPQYPTFTPM